MQLFNIERVVFVLIKKKASLLQTDKSCMCCFQNNWFILLLLLLFRLKQCLLLYFIYISLVCWERLEN